MDGYPSLTGKRAMGQNGASFFLSMYTNRHI